MSISDRDIRGILRRVLLSVEGIDENSVAYENRVFTPSSPTTMYVRENYAPGERAQVAFGLLELVGQVQWDVLFEINSSVEDAEALVGRILDAFAPGQSLSGASEAIQVVRAERGPVQRAEQGRMKISATITFRTHGTNP